MTADQLAGLDNRVTDEAGQPVAERRLIRGWFRIRRPPRGPSGVQLHVRIPGYLDETQPYPAQSAAERAARQIYARYREDVRALSDQSELRED